MMPGMISKVQYNLIIAHLALLLPGLDFVPLSHSATYCWSTVFSFLRRLFFCGLTIRAARTKFWWGFCLAWSAPDDFLFCLFPMLLPCGPTREILWPNSPPPKSYNDVIKLGMSQRQRLSWPWQLAEVWRTVPSTTCGQRLVLQRVHILININNKFKD